MRWDLEEGSTADLLKWWRREVAPVVVEEDVEVLTAVAVAARLRASSSSTLSSILISILLGFLLSIFSLLTIRSLQYNSRQRSSAQKKILTSGVFIRLITKQK